MHCSVLFAAQIESMMANLGGGSGYQCLECGYHSKVSTNVKSHIDAKHIVSTGYYCPHCPEVLKNKHALKNHLARVHKWCNLGKENDSLSLCHCILLFAAQIESMMANLGSGSGYQCLECGYHSKYSTNVKNHIDAKHIVSTGYYCPQCPEVLKNKHALKNHLSKVHKPNVWCKVG